MSDEQEKGILFKRKFTVDASGIDANGHYNNARYSEDLENSRVALQRAYGISDKTLRAQGLALFITYSTLTYVEELKAGHEVEICTGILSRGTASIYMRQEMKRKDELVNSGYFELVFVDINKNNRPISIDKAGERIENLQKLINKLPDIRSSENQNLPEVKVSRLMRALRRASR